MNPLSYCHLGQQGYPCSCAACTDYKSFFNIEQQEACSQASGSGFNGLNQYYARNIPTYPDWYGGHGLGMPTAPRAVMNQITPTFSTNTMNPVAPMGSAVSMGPTIAMGSTVPRGLNAPVAPMGDGLGFNAPVAPMGGGLVNDAESTQVQDVSNFSADTNTGQQGLSQGFKGFAQALVLDDAVPAFTGVPVPSQLSQQHQQGNTAGADISSPSSPQLNEEQPSQTPTSDGEMPLWTVIHGPPFVEKKDEPWLSEEESAKVKKYNDAVKEARAAYTREKNN
ncbi:hypothetical protein F5Y14DRAFT_414628, partial [Nemania sp. NC0429]